jgi:hypothetical protein
MIYRGPGFLAYDSSPSLPPPSGQQAASRRVSPVELTNGRGGEGVGAEPNHKTPGMTSINRSLLSGRILYCTERPLGF